MLAKIIIYNACIMRSFRLFSNILTNPGRLPISSEPRQRLVRSHGPVLALDGAIQRRHGEHIHVPSCQLSVITLDSSIIAPEVQQEEGHL